MRLLTFNHHSIDKNSTIDEVNEFFLDLSKGIKKYILENGIKNSRFFTELENFIRYEIIVGYKIIDAIKSLSRDLQSIILDLITMRCNDDCLNKLLEEEQDEILDYEIIFDNEAPENDYMILSFVLKKNGILLSFNRDRWINTPIEVLKYKDEDTTTAYIDNIATEEHANILIEQNILEKLPAENIIYSEEFKDWLLGKKKGNSPDINKVISKIEESIQDDFKVDLDLIKPLDKEVFEIRVGSLGGLQKSQIRILFKFDKEQRYILLGLIKKGSNTYDYTCDINKANEIFKTIKERELNEI
ncbi:MAG TPA: hypothetical protein EYG80_06175 [Flavobacteriaceae bacterium]|nr:hypothetical protein [Flavobacteriaceae bacterium]